MGCKVVVCGPAHSGKSVFLGGLKKWLPESYLFRACPDGEGTWTYRSPECVKYRKKGRFSKEQMDWYIHCLEGDMMSELVLVDVGGRITPENERIFRACDYAVILSSDEAKFAEWEDLCERTGVVVLDKVRSDYNGLSDSFAPCMTVHHLERGEDVSDRPVIKLIAAKLSDLVANLKKKDMSTEKKEGFSSLSLIKVSQLAAMLGKTAEEKELPNGRKVSSVNWRGEDLVAISRLLHNAEKEASVRIDGAAPAWLVAALAHECHPSVAEINSPDGWVTAVCGDPSENPKGNNLQWEMVDMGDGVMRVNVQQSDPSVPLKPADLQGWSAPSVPFDSVVVLSGRMPNWGMAALAMSYHGKCKACALYQPGVGATVAWTHSADVKLGDVLKVN